MKTCSDCKQEKTTDHFGANKTQPDFLHYYCKACVKKKTSERKEKNREYYKEWREQNKDYLNQYHREYRKANRKKLNEYQRNRPIEKKRLQNTDKKRQKDKTRRQQEEYKSKRREYFKRKYREDEQYRLKKQLESKLRSLLLKNDETSDSINLIGITIPEFKAYIESKFLPTMTSENYAEEWEYDWVVPFHSFDLTIEEEVQRCMHYTNIQPLFRTTRTIDTVEYIGNLNKNKY
jgi:hypothetical protein